MERPCFISSFFLSNFAFWKRLETLVQLSFSAELGIDWLDGLRLKILSDSFSRVQNQCLGFHRPKLHGQSSLYNCCVAARESLCNLTNQPTCLLSGFNGECFIPDQTRSNLLLTLGSVDSVGQIDPAPLPPSLSSSSKCEL